KKWIQRPLVKKEAIIQRQDVIALLYSDISLVNGIEQLLIRIGDIERVVGRIALDRAAIADYLALSRALLIIPECKNLLQKSVHVILVRIISENFGVFNELCLFLQNALCDEPSDEQIIKN